MNFHSQQSTMEQQKETKTNATLTRKQQEKLAAEKLERANKIVSIVIAVLSVVIIAGLLIFIPLSRKRAGLKEYFKLNGESVSTLEFNYYTNRIINNFLTSYGSYLSFFGLDASQDLNEQIFDSNTGMTWMDYFEQQAVNTIIETRALLADMKANNVSVDITETYNAYKENLTTTASSANMTVKNYLLNLYGDSATEERIMKFIEDEVTANAYYIKLTEKLEVSDEAVQAEIDANTIKYTSVDYRILPFRTNLAEDASESEVEEALKKAEQRANEMLVKVMSGEDFEDLCIDYAAENERTDYADPDTEKSLDTVTDLTPDDAYAGYSEWLFDEARKPNDATIYTDTKDNIVYVLKFEKRYLADSTRESVKESLTSAETNKYLDNLAAAYIVSDPKGNLSYLQKNSSNNAAE